MPKLHLLTTHWWHVFQGTGCTHEDILANVLLFLVSGFWFPNPRAISREIFSFSGEISIWNNGCHGYPFRSGGPATKGKWEGQRKRRKDGEVHQEDVYMYIGFIYVHRVLQHPRARLGVYTSTSLSCPHVPDHRDVISPRVLQTGKKK